MLCDFGWLPGLLWCFWSLYLPYVSGKRLFFIWFLKNVLVVSFSIFCFGVSALGLFYLGDFLGCCLVVLVESEGCRFILFLLSHLIQKIQKHLLFASLCIVCILHLHGTWIRFAWRILVIFSYRNDYIFIWRKILHFP